MTTLLGLPLVCLIFCLFTAISSLPVGSIDPMVALLVGAIEPNDPMKAGLTNLITQHSQFFTRLLMHYPQQSVVSVFEFDENPSEISKFIVDNLKVVLSKSSTELYCAHAKNRAISETESSIPASHYAHLFNPSIFDSHSSLPLWWVATKKPACKPDSFAKHFPLYCQFIVQLRSFYIRTNQQTTFLRFTQVYWRLFFQNTAHAFVSLVYGFSTTIPLESINDSFFEFVYGTQTTQQRLKYFEIVFSEVVSEASDLSSSDKPLLLLLFHKKHDYLSYICESFSQYTKYSRQLPFYSMHKRITAIKAREQQRAKLEKLH